MDMTTCCCRSGRVWKINSCSGPGPTVKTVNLWVTPVQNFLYESGSGCVQVFGLRTGFKISAHTTQLTTERFQLSSFNFNEILNFALKKTQMRDQYIFSQFL